MLSVPTEVEDALERWSNSIGVVLRDSESGIAVVSGRFQAMAHDSDLILEKAAAIIASVEDENLSDVPPRVRAVIEAARGFIHERLAATGNILETATTEAKLLTRLSQLTRGQRSAAREIQTLAMLTNIEVARLGQLGLGFGYLAHELDEFARAVAEGTRELSAHTEQCSRSIEQTRTSLNANLPRMQEDFARIESGLGEALTHVDASLNQLLAAPSRFRSSVEEIAQLITGVVSAVQSQDITRQQLEHVQQALVHISRFGVDEEQAWAGDAEAMTAAGLAVQHLQLENVCHTVEDWIGRIRTSVRTIHQINSSEVVSIAPLVLEQEKMLSAELARIEQFEQECEADSEEIRRTLKGLDDLMRLVGEHLERSHQVRDRLQLLTFNSIVEANRLGSKADSILEISQSIKRISASWAEMTEESARVQGEIMTLIESSGSTSEHFAQQGSDQLRLAREQTRESLQALHSAAEQASRFADGLEKATASLQATATEASRSGDHLEGTLAPLSALLAEIYRRHPKEGTGSKALSDSGKLHLEQLFEPAYTTQIERGLLRASLYGDPMPGPEVADDCNSVELF